MFRSLLVPLDGSAFSECALPLARSLASWSSGTVHLVQVHPASDARAFLPTTPFQLSELDLESYAARYREESRIHLDRIAAQLASGGILADVSVLEGRVVEALVERAHALRADSVVMTTHGRSGAQRMWLGSVADGLVRHLTIPILLVHPDAAEECRVDTSTIGRILVPLDGSELAEAILEPVSALARASDATLVLAHVIASSLLPGGTLPLGPVDTARVRTQAEAYLEGAAERVRAAGLQADVHLVERETPAAAIPEMADEVGADLIALATHGYGGLRRMVLGSVADKVLRASRRPLLVMRPREPGT